MTLVKPILVVLGCMVTILAVDGPAVAGTVDDIFARLDTNGDGVITRPEFQNNLFEVFFVRDASENIKLELSESRLYPEAFAAADSDGDGALSGVEFNDAPFTQFETADANTDHEITREEFERFAQQFIDG